MCGDRRKRANRQRWVRDAGAMAIEMMRVRAYVVEGSVGFKRGEIEWVLVVFFFFQAEDGIRDLTVTGVQTCALPIFVEHEYPPARIQDKARLHPILAGSLAFVRHIDEAAAAMYALQHEVLAAQNIPLQGKGREAYRS